MVDFKSLADKPCPFCTLPPERIVLRSASGVLVRDGYPVSKGHSLVIPHRHTGSFFDLTEAERTDLLALLDQAKQELDALHPPDGYNIGINDGTAARQTVPHLHIHLIPRYQGNLPDPGGGGLGRLYRQRCGTGAAFWRAYCA